MSDQMSAPRDPGSYARRRPSGFGLWALIVFGLACIAAGYGLARFGPQLYPDKPRPGTAAEPATPAAAPSPVAPLALAEPAAPPVETETDGGVAERVEALELDQGRVASAAASALAADMLADAAEGSRPFAAEVKALAAVSPALDLRILAAEAERGAPSRAALAASFPDYAARAASAARAPQDGAGVMARIGYALSRVVALRRVGDVPGSGPDAMLAKAERQVEDGDVVAALATLDALPAAAKEALGPWRDRAERRARIDREIAQVRTQALDELARIARSGS